MEEHSRINRAATRSHGQAIYRRKAHGRCDAVAGEKRTHACAVAKVRNDCATNCRAGVEFRQPRRDVFVRESMKSVTQYALLKVTPGQSKSLCQRRLAAMKRSVKAGDLRQLRCVPCHCLNG